MKTIYHNWNWFLLIFATCATGLLFIYDHTHKPDFYQLPNHKDEMFDPKLSFIQSPDKLRSVVDSLGEEALKNKDSSRYAILADSIVRERFYHGFSQFSLKDNHIAFLLASLLRPLRAYVDAPLDAVDILKYAHAGCSQQAIVLATLLQSKGFIYNYVGLSGKMGGHFVVQVKIHNRDCFFDPNIERHYLKKNRVYSIQELITNPQLLHRTYANLVDTAKLDEWISSPIWISPKNQIAGWNAFLFQKCSQVLSYILFPFLLVLLIIQWRKRR